MPLKLSKVGRRAIKGPRIEVRRRGFRQPGAQETLPLVINGDRLTIPETKIYIALKALVIPFTTRKKVGGSRRLGAGVLDFWLPFHKIVIEYQGPFHASLIGGAKDFRRQIVRRQFGAAQIVYLYERDLDDLFNRLNQVINAPANLAITTR